MLISQSPVSNRSAVYAVESLPSTGARGSQRGCTSSSPSTSHPKVSERESALLDCVKQLLLDVSRTPMFGVNPDELQGRMDAMVAADEAAREACRQRTLAIGAFYEWACGPQRRICSSKLQELLLAFTE